MDTIWRRRAPTDFIVNEPADVSSKPWTCLPHVSSANDGYRYNEGKLRYDLLPPDALEKVVLVLTKGTEKYPAHNWEKGLKWNEGCYASLMRHLQAWAQGRDRDPETGLLHLAHASVNALFLLTHQLRGVGQDDRNLAAMCPTLHPACTKENRYD